MQEFKKVKKKYKKLISKAEQNDKEEYIHLTKEEMWYLADDTDTNIQDMAHYNQYVICEPMEANVLEIQVTVSNITGIQEYWDLIFEEFSQMKSINNEINNTLNDICAKKFNGMSSDEWYNVNDEVYISYSDYLKFKKILELTYLYECYLEMFWINIENFDSKVKLNFVYPNIKKQLESIINLGYDMQSVLEMAYYICQMLSIDFSIIAKKFKQFNNSHKLIKYSDRKDIMQDV